MTPDVVADVGNSRIKWGRCGDGAVRDTCSLPPEEPVGWEQQRQRWGLGGDCQWVVTGVHPRAARTIRRVACASAGSACRVLDKPGGSAAARAGGAGRNTSAWIVSSMRWRPTVGVRRACRR